MVSSLLTDGFYCPECVKPKHPTEIEMTLRNVNEHTMNLIKQRLQTEGAEPFMITWGGYNVLRELVSAYGDFSRIEAEYSSGDLGYNITFRLIVRGN